MRLRSLEIEHFGLFSGRDFVFSNHGLQLVYGPNEAGKSTLLQLIREVLFGFPLRNPYAFAAHAGEMAAVATIEMADGTTARFRRRKGRVKEVVGEILEGGRQDDGRPLDAAALSRLLGGASVELFQNVFGFSLAELSAGEQSLQHARLSEALYGGALGGLAGFRQVLDDLEQEHEKLFSPSATKRPINQLLADIRRQGKELRAAQVRPRDYEQLEQELRGLSEQVEQLRTRRDELQRQQSRCGQLARAIGLWQQRQNLIAELATLDIPHDFPRDGDQQYQQHQAEHDQIAAELDDFQQELNDVSAQLVSLAPRTELLARAGESQRLAQQLDKIRGFRRDIGLRQQESQMVQAAVKARLRELDPTWELEHLQRFQTSMARRASIEAMQDELDDLERQRRDLQSRSPALETDIATMTQQLAALSDENAMSPLADLVESAGDYQGHQEKLQQYQRQLRDCAARRESLQRKLNAPFSYQLSDLHLLPVPMAAAVAEFRQGGNELNQHLQRCLLSLERAQADLEQRRNELAMLQAQDDVPDRQQLADARSRRDRGWDLVRRKFVESTDVPADEIDAWTTDGASSLPQAYEASVRHADHVADQRQQQAEVVARQDQLAGEILNCQRIVEQDEQACAASRQAQERWEQNWKNLWSPGKIEPGSPDAMLDWLRLHAELIDAVAQHDAIQGHWAAEQDAISHYESELEAALGDVAGPPASRLAEARRRLQQAREALAERKSYATQLPRKQYQLAAVQQELAALEKQSELWQQRWRPLMEEFGFPTSWDIYTATRVLNGLSEARTQQREAESLDQRVQDMQQGLDQFEQEVTSLCQELAPELVEFPAENAVEELCQLLEQARQQTRDQQSLQQQRVKLETRCDAKRKQLQRVEQTLRRLLDAAGAASEQEILQIGRRVRRWFELRENLEAIEHQLRALRGNEEPAEFEAALVETDPTELESRQRLLRAELERVDQQFNEALQANGVAAERLRELDQASQAAAIAQDLESTRSQLRETVDRWVPLVLARTFMRQAMEQFEREHQPRMLIDVARLLQGMTLGRYTEMSRKLDEQGSLQVRQVDGQLKEPHQLSTGTREQLYLAIRLAYVLHYCREAEPLPIVMDDVLVNFDDSRAAETLQTLLGISQDVQIILLTCHRNTVDLVESLLPQLEPIALGA